MKNFSGLTSKQAKEKLEEYGPNELNESNNFSAFKILVRQIKKNMLIYLLVAASLMSFFVGKSITGYAILGVIFVVVVAGFIQEYRAEKSINALKKMIRPLSVVIRDGKEIEINSRDIAVGDIIILRTGEKIPADCIVLDAQELSVNESALTGESKEVNKTESIDEKSQNKNNLLFMGTFIINGRCIAKVLNTGMNTEFGKIAGMISAAEKELPLQKKINDIVKYMTIFAIIVSLLTGVIMFTKAPFSYELVIEILIVVIALCVSAFPEGLPVVLITVLARGTWNMADKNAIVNRMSIIETLGETTVICSDKTGTLTKGEMTVKKIFMDGKMIDVGGTGYVSKGNFLYTNQNNQKIDIGKNKDLNFLLKASVICNDARVERTDHKDEYRVSSGTPTEASLLIMSAKVGIFRKDLNFILEEELPFNSKRKRRTVLSEEGNDRYIYSIGASEILTDKCNFIQNSGKTIEFDKLQKQKIAHINDELTQQGYRLMTVCYKQAEAHQKAITEDNMIFLGLLAIYDPPREEVPDALRLCKEAGIKVKIITGDNKETAKQIAKQIGIEGNVISGDEIEKLSDYELSKKVNDITIFARVQPEHKLRIVNAFRQNGEIVTMTGDGVNDAPALKQAHIGVAMGKNGTDVSRQASDLILKDDNFATIVYAIKEGRIIFNNLQKCVAYQISINFAQLFLIFFAIALGMPLPLVAMHILFMNLFSDEVTAIALSFNHSSGDIMKTRPRKKSGILNKHLLSMILIAGSIMCIVSLSVFYYVLNVLGQSETVAQTTTLLTMIFFAIANAFNFRSFRKSVLGRSLFVNKYLIWASIISVLLSLIIVFWSPMNLIFETAPIGLFNIALAFFASLSIVLVFDVLKMLLNRKRMI
ncbi:MAG: cation-transporting P-type ATPase [Candidatus Aenigmarchaeota archaeon]|nr:cation-transporting P-type ATPase [Candidatus Aenigmarchaeota archaeon]